jgi:ribosomal protein S16
LPLGGQQCAVNVAPGGAAKQLGRRGIDLVGDFGGNGRMHRNGRCASRHYQIVVVGGRQQRRLGIGRSDLDVQRGEGSPDLVDVQKIRRCQKPITPASHALERQTGGFRLLQELRNTGARPSDRRGEILTGVECAVGKLAQQREPKRSKH